MNLRVDCKSIRGPIQCSLGKLALPSDQTHGRDLGAPCTVRPCAQGPVGRARRSLSHPEHEPHRLNMGERTYEQNHRL